MRLDSESLPRRPCCRNLEWDFEIDSLDPQWRLEENAYIQQSLVVDSWGTWSRDLGMFLMLEWSGWPICPFKGQGPYQPTFLPFRNPSKSCWDVPVEIPLIFSLDNMNIYLRLYTWHETWNVPLVGSRWLARLSFQRTGSIPAHLSPCQGWGPVSFANVPTDIPLNPSLWNIVLYLRTLWSCDDSLRDSWCCPLAGVESLLVMNVPFKNYLISFSTQ